MMERVVRGRVQRDERADGLPQRAGYGVSRSGGWRIGLDVGLDLDCGAAGLVCEGGDGG